MTAPEAKTPCPPWCRNDHAGGEDLFHQSPPWIFEVRHGETRVPEEADVSVKGWDDALAVLDEPDAVVLNLRTDCWGDAWLTVKQARLLASHLLLAAEQLEDAGALVQQ